MRHVQLTRRVTWDLPENGQKLGPKYFGTVINKKNFVQHVGVNTLCLLFLSRHKFS